MCLHIKYTLICEIRYKIAARHLEIRRCTPKHTQSCKERTGSTISNVRTRRTIISVGPVPPRLSLYFLASKSTAAAFNGINEQAFISYTYIFEYNLAPGIRYFLPPLPVIYRAACREFFSIRCRLRVGIAPSSLLFDSLFIFLLIFSFLFSRGRMKGEWKSYSAVCDRSKENFLRRVRGGDARLLRKRRWLMTMMNLASLDGRRLASPGARLAETSLAVEWFCLIVHWRICKKAVLVLTVCGP